jgi:hypothetical protein
MAARIPTVPGAALVRRARSIPTLVAAVALAIGGCAPEGLPEEAASPPARAEALTIAVATDPCTGAGASLDLGCAAPPDTFDASSPTGTAWDIWAWNTFAALNWPALASSDGVTYPSGYVRGVPDTAQSFAGAAPGDVLVWETFKEKRELFNDNAQAGSWQELTFGDTYAPNFFTGGQIEPCTGLDAALHERVKASPRLIAQLSKQAPALDGEAIGPNAPDETAEVASPAQESQDALCAGYSGNQLTLCQQFFAPPPGGGGGTEYAATDDNDRPGVGPRVFKGAPGADNFIYYEVKLNWDYYDYVVPAYNDYDTTAEAARAGSLTLPYRTSATGKPQGSGNPEAICNYDAAATRDCYGTALGDCPNLETCTTGVDQTIGPASLPAIGSIQLKSAWLPVGLVDGDASDFHTTAAVYYQDSPGQPNGLCYAVQELALIGLHIIQRVHGGAPGAAPQPIGGTFVFATWEHVSIGNGSAYTYVNYDSDGGAETDVQQPYPNTAAGIQVSRLQAYPLPTTQAVNAAAHAAVGPDSLWNNYMLVGTQFIPTSSERDSEGLDQPYYLANLVIETNRGLQQFQGLPPGVTPIEKYSQAIGNTSLPGAGFTPGDNNLSFNGNGFGMGGCMGCHGVAQANGFDFSFVLQDGSKGTKPDTATSVAIPPIAPPTSP